MIKIYDKFYYANKYSEDMGVLSVEFEDNGGHMQDNFIARRTIKEIQTNERNEPYFQKVEYEPLEFSLELWFTQKMDETKIREIRRWLNQTTYQPLFFEGYEDKIYYCLPINQSEITYNSILQGYVKLEMRCKTYYAETPSYQTSIYNLSNNNEDGTEVVLENKGDLESKPDIWIKKIGDGGIEIINTNNCGKTTEFSEATQSKGTLHITNTVYDEELVKIGDKVYEFDTGDGIINSHVTLWKPDMMYIEGIFVNKDGVIYKCIKSNNDKEWVTKHWEKQDESNIKVDLSSDASPSKAKLVFNSEPIKDSDSISINNTTYEFDLNGVYNANNGNVPIDIKNYTTKAKGILRCKNNETFGNAQITIGEKKYHILPTSTAAQIVVDNKTNLISWDKFHFDYNWNEPNKLNKIMLLLNEKRDNSINGLRLPYFNESDNDNSLPNRKKFELHKLTKLKGIPNLGSADTGKFEPKLCPIDGQVAGDKLSIFKRSCCGIHFDSASSTKSKIVVARGENGQLAQGGVRNPDLEANPGDFVMICKVITDSPKNEKLVDYNGQDYIVGDFEILRIKATGQTYNGEMVNYHRFGTAWYELEEPSSMFVVNKRTVHGLGKIVYGTGIDLENAKKYLSVYSYTFVNTSGMSVKEMKKAITSNDIIVGGTLVKGGVSEEVGKTGANRLAGDNRFETEARIRDYAEAIRATYEYGDGAERFYMILFRKQQEQITILGGDSFTKTYQIKQGDTLDETCDNIVKAINESGVDWYHYSKGTFKNDMVTAEYDKNSKTIIVEAIESGSEGNKIITTINDWDTTQNLIQQGIEINQFDSKTLEGGSDPTYDMVDTKSGKSLIKYLTECLNNDQDDFNISYSGNTITIVSKKYGSMNNLVSVISNCFSCDFKNMQDKFTVTLEGGSDPSVETIINELTKVMSENNNNLIVEKNLENKHIRVTMKKSGKDGNIAVGTTAINLYWDCQKKLKGGEDGLTDGEEVYLNGEYCSVESDKNVNIADVFNNEELILQPGCNRLIVKGNCYIQFNNKFKLL